MTEIKDFIYNSCIDGIPITNSINRNNHNPADDYYLKVTYDEAKLIEKQGFKFEGTIQENKKNVIRISIKDREQIENILINARNKNIVK